MGSAMAIEIRQTLMKARLQTATTTFKAIRRDFDCSLGRMEGLQERLIDLSGDLEETEERLATDGGWTEENQTQLRLLMRATMALLAVVM